jgi:ABC-2 type transport system permease protein
MFRHIAVFELRYHVKSPVFWVTALIFGLLTFGAVTSDNIQIGGVGNVKVNSPYAIAVTCMVMSVFAIFIMTAFVANVIVRDDETGFAPIVRATRVSKFDYLFGRFSGAFSAGCIAFAAVPTAMLIGSLMPWLDPEELTPFAFGPYLRVYVLLCLPTLFVTASACFALATLTRSLLSTYVGVVAFVMLYLVATASMERPEFERTLALLDPFGIGSFNLATKYWTATERNTKLPAFEGIMLWNRCLWFGLSFVLLGLTWLLFRSQALARKVRRVAPAPVEDLVQLPAHALTLPSRVHTAPRNGWLQLITLARFDMAAVFRSPAFFVLLGIGFINSGAGLWYADEFYGNTIYPVTRVMIKTLMGSFTIIPLMIAIYYAGELVWRDRERRVHEIVDATPAPDWTFVLPKVLAISLVLFATVLVSVLAAVVVQLIKGYTKLELVKYFDWYVIPWSVDIVLTAMLCSSRCSRLTSSSAGSPCCCSSWRSWSGRASATNTICISTRAGPRSGCRT